MEPTREVALELVAAASTIWPIPAVDQRMPTRKPVRASVHIREPRPLSRSKIVQGPSAEPEPPQQAEISGPIQRRREE